MRTLSRQKLGWIGLAAAGSSALITSVAAAQSTSLALPATSWSLWLQNVANVSRVVELGAFLFGAYQFWAGRRERIVADVETAKQARIDTNYQAWQVINSAQGKGGSGGRIEALADLLRNGVSLAGIRLDDAWLEGVQLPGAILLQASLQRANLSRANFAEASLEGADLRSAELVGADLTGANLRGANLADARLAGAILNGADLTDLTGWREMRSISHASIEGIRHAPAGFLEFARENGAGESANDLPIADQERSYSNQFRAI